MIRSILTIKTKAYIFQTLETNPRLQGHHFFTTETTKTIKENIFRRGINYTKDGKRIWNKRWFRKIVRVGRVLGLCAAVWAGGYQLGTLSVAQDPQTFYRNLMRQTLLNCECNSVVEINESEPLVSSLYVNGRTPTIVLKDEQTQTYSKVMATHPGHPMWVSAIHSQRVFHRIKEAAHDFAVGMIEEIKRKQSAAEREGNGDGDVNVNEEVNHVSTSEASLDGNWTVRWLNGDTERITVRSGSWTFPPGTTYTLNEDGCSFTWPSDGTVQTLQTNTTAASQGTLTWSTTNADYPTIFWDPSVPITILDWWEEFVHRLTTNNYMTRNIFPNPHPANHGIDLFPRNHPLMVSHTTNGICVEASTIHLGNNDMGWTYSIRLKLIDVTQLPGYIETTKSDETDPNQMYGAQLMSRHWVITDGDTGSVRHVDGPGVVGCFPILHKDGYIDIQPHSQNSTSSLNNQGWFIYQSMSGALPYGSTFGGTLTFIINRDGKSKHVSNVSSKNSLQFEVQVPTFKLSKQEYYY